MKKACVNLTNLRATSWEYLKFLSLQRMILPSVDDEYVKLVGSIANRAKKITDIPLAEILERTDKFLQGYFIGSARSRTTAHGFPHFNEIHDDDHHNLHGLAHASLVCMEATKFFGIVGAGKGTTLESFFALAKNIHPTVTLWKYRRYLSSDVNAEKKLLKMAVSN